MKRIANRCRAAAIGLLAVLAAGCDVGAPAAGDSPLAPGLLATTRIFGFTYENEVVAVDGHVGTWESRWRDRVVSVFKLYRGIFPISAKEMENSFVNEFETGVLDSLFPLSIGRSVSFSGMHHAERENEDVRFWAHFIVRGEETVKIKDGEHQTFIIDLTVDYEYSSGMKRLERTMWYSPDLGIVLKSSSVFGEEKWAQYVLSIDPPEDEAGRQRRRTGSPLGTTTI